MPNTYVVNQKPTTYGQAFSLLAEMLAGAGWTYEQSGDGLAAFSSGSVLNNFVSGAANSWNNVRPWVRLRDPGGVKEFTFQLANGTTGGASNQMRVKFSPAAGFTTGGSANTTPSATDERLMWGGGTDAAPTFAGWWSAGTVANPATAIHQGAALAAAPYGFWFAAHNQATAASLVGGALGKAASIMLDPLTAVPEDPAPYVILVDGGSGFTTSPNTAFGRDGGSTSLARDNWALTSGPQSGCFAYTNLALTEFRYVQPAMYVANTTGATPGTAGASLVAGGGQSLQGGVLINPFNGKNEMLPVPYLRVQASTGTTGGGTIQPLLKGWSTMMRWTGTTRYSFMDTLNDRDWICVGVVWLPWDGASQPIW